MSDSCLITHSIVVFVCSAFRHDPNDATLTMRARNFVKMRKLVIKDRLDNDEQAEIERSGVHVDNSRDEDDRLILQSGGINEDDE